MLQEFYVQATRASRQDPVSHQHAVRLIESFRRFPVQDITDAILMSALTAADRKRYHGICNRKRIKDALLDLILIELILWP